MILPFTNDLFFVSPPKLQLFFICIFHLTLIESMYTHDLKNNCFLKNILLFLAVLRKSSLSFSFFSFFLLLGLYGLPKRNGKLKDISHFDASFFGVHPKQANTMDPQLRLILEVAYEAIVDGGKINPKNINK